jgi:hypothetical protein
VEAEEAEVALVDLVTALVDLVVMGAMLGILVWRWRWC